MSGEVAALVHSSAPLLAVREGRHAGSRPKTSRARPERRVHLREHEFRRRGFVGGDGLSNLNVSHKGAAAARHARHLADGRRSGAAPFLGLALVVAGRLVEDEDALLAVRPVEKTLQECIVLGAPQARVRLDGIDPVPGRNSPRSSGPSTCRAPCRPWSPLSPVLLSARGASRGGGAVAFSAGRCPLPSGLRVRWRAAKTSVPAALGEARFLPGVEIAPTKPANKLGVLRRAAAPSGVNNDLT